VYCRHTHTSHTRVYGRYTYTSHTHVNCRYNYTSHTRVCTVDTPTSHTRVYCRHTHTSHTCVYCRYTYTSHTRVCTGDTPTHPTHVYCRYTYTSHTCVCTVDTPTHHTHVCTGGRVLEVFVCTVLHTVWLRDTTVYKTTHYHQPHAEDRGRQLNSFLGELCLWKQYVRQLILIQSISLKYQWHSSDRLAENNSRNPHTLFYTWVSRRPIGNLIRVFNAKFLGQIPFLTPSSSIILGFTFSASTVKKPVSEWVGFNVPINTL